MYKVNFDFETAVRLAEEAVAQLPKQGATVIPNPGRMFDATTFEPVDLVARILVLGGFDAKEAFSKHTEASEANTKHFFLKYKAWIKLNDEIFCGPHFKTVVFLSELSRKMDRGYSAEKSVRWAARYAERATPTHPAALAGWL